MNMLPLEIFPLAGGKIVPEPDDRLTEDEELYAAASICNEVKSSKIQGLPDKYLREEITLVELNIGIRQALREYETDRKLSLESLAAKYPQETADAIAQIMLTRSSWRPFLPEQRVYILGTRNFYLHRGESAL